MEQKPKIYYLLREATPIAPISGDSITEIGIIKALSKNYDVFYNGEQVDFSKKNFGLTRTSVYTNVSKYDLYIIRNNPELFKTLPNPKLYFAVPYDNICFNQASAIYTFTNSWTNGLKFGYDFPYNAYPKGFKYNNTITLTQVIDDHFFAKRNEARIRKIRKKIGGEFIIGHFGKVADSCYPHSFLSILKKLKKKYPNVKVIFCGNSKAIRKIGEKYDVGIMNFSYEEMPDAISACDLILYNYRDGQGHIAGSMKILEAMARGVPVLCPRYNARVEELGSDYELFYPYENICATNAAPTKDRFSPKIERKMFRIIERAINEPEWLHNQGNKIQERAKYYSVDESAKRFKVIIDKLIKGE